MKAQKTISTIALAAAMGVLIQVQTAQASIAAETNSLANLQAGGSLSVGDKIFNNFGSLATDLSTFNANNIQVIATEVSSSDYLLTWNGNITIGGAAPPFVDGDLLLTYTVTALYGNKIVAIDQGYSGQIDPIGGPVIAGLTVTENAYANPGSQTVPVAYSYLNQNLTGTSFNAIGAILTPDQVSVNVTKDINLGIISGAGTVTISQIEQSFEQTVPVPEATTVIAGMLLLLPLGASTIKILRNRKASA